MIFRKSIGSKNPGPSKEAPVSVTLSKQSKYAARILCKAFYLLGLAVQIKTLHHMINAIRICKVTSLCRTSAAHALFKLLSLRVPISPCLHCTQEAFIIVVVVVIGSVLLLLLALLLWLWRNHQRSRMLERLLVINPDDVHILCPPAVRCVVVQNRMKGSR